MRRFKPIEQKQQLFDYLDNNERLSFPELLKKLNLNKNDGWYGNKQLVKGLQGNTTKFQIANYLKSLDNNIGLLRFDLSNQRYNYIDKPTGEVVVKE